MHCDPENYFKSPECVSHHIKGYTGLHFGKQTIQQNVDNIMCAAFTAADAMLDRADARYANAQHWGKSGKAVQELKHFVATEKQYVCGLAHRDDAAHGKYRPEPMPAPMPYQKIESGYGSSFGEAMPNPRRYGGYGGEQTMAG